MSNEIRSLNELKEIVAKLKSEGKKIVFTNGCFDLLHIGHIRYLKEAKKLGDILIVGLNSDASVRRLKPQRPLNEESQRAEVLASLEMVDFVTLFSEDTPYELIKSIRPDVLVKGGDWKKEDIVGSDIVAEVHSLPYVPGVSTSAIINKILKSGDGL
jgi:rfaE bifunctional protein nucleotidyltransferase chain/domain